MLAKSLEDIFQEQKRDRVSQGDERHKLTKPKIQTLLRAFELFQDLAQKYEQDASKKQIASYLVTNVKKVQSIIGNTESSKLIAREDGDYEELSSLEHSLRSLQKSDFFAHSIKSV